MSGLATYQALASKRDKFGPQQLIESGRVPCSNGDGNGK
jgi:hypothetical protein